MKKTLPPFQRAGSKFLQEHPHALLADEPGLGKTVQAIDAAETLGFQSVLVVCPASVRTNWRQEMIECVGSLRNWRIISYEQSRNFSGGDYKYDALILDEAHFLKTPDSQRTQAIFGNKTGLARSAQYAIWALTGTPVLNRPRELWPILKCLHPSFSTMTSAFYDQRYCGAYFDGRGINNKGASRLDELQQRLNGFMLRRTKKEVMPQLPEKIITRVPLTVEEKDLNAIRAAEDEILDREAKLSAAAEDFSQLGDMARLLRITGLAKVQKVAEFVAELLETEEKVVVFTRHRDVLAQIFSYLSDYCPQAFQGGQSDIEKASAIARFREVPDCRIFLANITAGGTGINGLQEVASSVVFAELSWVPGEMQQAIDRLHRIGQTAGAVNVYLTHVPGSMESAVLGVQNAKGSVVGRLMGEKGWRA